MVHSLLQCFMAYEIVSLLPLGGRFSAECFPEGFTYINYKGHPKSSDNGPISQELLLK